MKYNQLQESIINVPNALIHRVNLYVASYLYFKLNQFVQNADLMLPRDTTPEEKEKKIKDAKQTMAKLYSKYNASNITAASANQLINNSINLKVNIEQFFKELNYKGVDPGLVDLLKNKFKFELFLSNAKGTGTRGSQESNTPYSSRINVNVGNLTSEPSFMSNANQIMSTVYHEAQHAVQSIAIKNINNSSNQLEIKPDYSNTVDKSDYYSSGIEYTPQLGNIVDDVSNFLEQDALNNNLNDNKNEAIKDALQRSVQDNTTSTRHFLSTLYKKEPEKYKKALKTIYTKVSPIYDELKENGINYSYSDVPPEDLDVNVNVMTSAYKKLKSNPDSYDIELYGNSADDLSRIKCTNKNHGWSIELTKSPSKQNAYNIRLISGEFEESVDNINSQDVLNIIGSITDLPYMEADDVLDNIDFMDTDVKNPTEELISDSIDQLANVANMYSVDFKHTSTDTFELFGTTFKVEPYDERRVLVENDTGEVFFMLSLKQFVLLFQNLIRIYSSDEEFVNKLLRGGYTYIECMSKIGEL